MKANECLQVAKVMKRDLEKQVDAAGYSVELVNGKGFRYLQMSSDALVVPSVANSSLVPFFESYLASIDVSPQVHESLSMFCKILPKVKDHSWKKFEFLYANQHGKGSWIGVYFHVVDEETCEFYSNHLKCAFELMPDVYVLRQFESSSFGPFRTTDSYLTLKESTRGFSRQDLEIIMSVCNGVTEFKTKALTEH